MENCYEMLMNNKDIILSDDEKSKLIRRFETIDSSIDCIHKPEEPLEFIEFMLLNLPMGNLVEAGCYKGGGTAKFSILAKTLQKKLYVFDSFEGLPAHEENHTINIYGKAVTFTKGEYSSDFEVTKENVRKYGDIECCEFVKGWFKDTLPNFNERIAGAYIDVDLVESVKECMSKLFPFVAHNGAIFCHDGHLPLVIELLEDARFWSECVKSPKPHFEGLGERKLIKITKQ